MEDGIDAGFGGLELLAVLHIKGDLQVMELEDRLDFTLVEDLDGGFPRDLAGVWGGGRFSAAGDEQGCGDDEDKG